MLRKFLEFMGENIDYAVIFLYIYMLFFDTTLGVRNSASHWEDIAFLAVVVLIVKRMD